MKGKETEYVLKNIFLYPVKSMAGTTLYEAEADVIGLRGDRRFMLIDENNRFISSRTYPLLTLIKPTVDNECIRFAYQGQDFVFPYHHQWKTFEAKIWDDKASVYVTHDSINDWISNLLQVKLRLVVLASENARLHTSASLPEPIPVSLADGYPYQILGTASIEKLARMYGDDINPMRFRPNLLVSTSIPHEEDTWKTIKIGNAIFEKVKDCGRCQVINIDPETAAIDNNITKKLATYRKFANQILFGSLWKIKQTGIVHVGDSIEVITE